MVGGSFLLMLVLYVVLGHRASLAKFNTAQWIETFVVAGVNIACNVLGTKARRALAPAAEDFNYSSAFVAGVMITLFAALLGIATSLVYASLPRIADLSVEAAVEQWKAGGWTKEKIDEAVGLQRQMMGPPLYAAYRFLAVMCTGALISLVSSAFLKRHAIGAPPGIAT